ncbi:MAG: hypothetical protein OHK0013_15090 [Sandaracinaceae bacterium]
MNVDDLIKRFCVFDGELGPNFLIDHLQLALRPRDFGGVRAREVVRDTLRTTRDLGLSYDVELRRKHLDGHPAVIWTPPGGTGDWELFLGRRTKAGPQRITAVVHVNPLREAARQLRGAGVLGPLEAEECGASDNFIDPLKVPAARAHREVITALRALVDDALVSYRQILRSLFHVEPEHVNAWVKEIELTWDAASPMGAPIELFKPGWCHAIPNPTRHYPTRIPVDANDHRGLGEWKGRGVGGMHFKLYPRMPRVLRYEVQLTTAAIKEWSGKALDCSSDSAAARLAALARRAFEFILRVQEAQPAPSTVDLGDVLVITQSARKAARLRTLVNRLALDGRVVRTKGDDFHQTDLELLRAQGLAQHQGDGVWVATPLLAAFVLRRVALMRELGAALVDPSPLGRKPRGTRRSR